MKKITSFIFIGFISLLICFFMFFMVILCLFIPKNPHHMPAEKSESSIPYSSPLPIPSSTILLQIENCPVRFLIKTSPKKANLSVTCTEDFPSENKSIRNISFKLDEFENTVNYLGGVEIETPYGLPCPAKNKKIIAKDEKLLVHGASLGEILTIEATPSTERKNYYCYVIKELCLEFFSECTPESYKFLKQNCETDISYTEFYDNYKSLKNIKR